MREKGRHSRESGNPGYLKGARLTETTRYFSLKAPAWMPACAGMTNYDPVTQGGESFRMRAILYIFIKWLDFPNDFILKGQY
jgi:hypothetical protein